MSTTTLPAPTDMETTARGRVAALAAEHGLPEPVRVHFNPDLWVGYENRRVAALAALGYDKGFIAVYLRARPDVARWAAVLGAQTKTEHEIFEYDDGCWLARWIERFSIAGWLPDIELTVRHHDERWIDPPAATG